MIKKQNGFTLIELMIVVAIISILSALMLPKFGKQIAKTKDAKVLEIVANLRSGKTIFESDNLGKYPESMTGIGIYMDNSYESYIGNGILTGSVTSYLMLAGVVIRGNITSIGRGKFNDIKNTAEIYYDNTTGDIWVDGTTGSGVDFVDTKGNLWNRY